MQSEVAGKRSIAAMAASTIVRVTTVYTLAAAQALAAINEAPGAVPASSAANADRLLACLRLLLSYLLLPRVDPGAGVFVGHDAAYVGGGGQGVMRGGAESRADPGDPAVGVFVGHDAAFVGEDGQDLMRAVADLATQLLRPARFAIDAESAVLITEGTSAVSRAGAASLPEDGVVVGCLAFGEMGDVAARCSGRSTPLREVSSQGMRLPPPPPAPLRFACIL